MLEEIKIDEWVSEAETNSNKEFRQAIHTILAAIAADKNLKANMILKGGILLAVRYRSHRYTKDIDLSTSKKLAEIEVDNLIDELNQSLALITETLNYDLECIVQSHKIMPAHNSNATFPSIKITVGYAYKGTPKHKRLLGLQSPTAISIDYSLNESTPNIDDVLLTDSDGILVYSLIDLIAEKLRSLLQQEDRNRQRRQDVFDLCLIFEKFRTLENHEIQNIYSCMLEKCRSRGIEPSKASFQNKELYRRAKAEYHTLADEIEGDLPNFDESFERVRVFYESLPW